MANTWVTEEAVRQVADNGLVHYSGTQRLAESCLRAGLREAARRLAQGREGAVTMSYDLALRDPITKAVLQLDEPHQMKGGTYCLGGTDEAELNITYNYCEHFQRVLGGQGIRSLYGLTGAESIPRLEAASAQLGDDIDEDYWKSTEGNAKRALLQLLALARLRPDGVWDGD